MVRLSKAGEIIFFVIFLRVQLCQVAFMIVPVRPSSFIIQLSMACLIHHFEIYN